jgi:hypothetical protein
LKGIEMKLTLRKANAVQAAINEAIKTLELTYSVSLNEFQGVAEQIQTARDQFWANADTRNKLTLALYDIRTKVAQANASAGINDMLANVAYLEKQISHNTMLAGKGSQTAMAVLNGQVKKNAEVKEDSYGYSRRDVTTSIFTDAEIADFKSKAATHKRVKQKLQDALLELNVQTEVELEAETVAVLKAADII